MDWNRSAAEIAAAWQTELETKLEAGATPLLLAGTSALPISGASTLLAYQQFAAARTDITTPLLIAGGSSALWLGLLLAPGASRGAPLPTVVYGGPDLATYLASVTTLSSGVPATPPLVQTGTPPEMTDFLSPRLAPALSAPWEALPFVEIGESPRPALAGPAPSADPTGDWIAWGALLLALCLVLSALLI
jgi:hypothetical protein